MIRLTIIIAAVVSMLCIIAFVTNPTCSDISNLLQLSDNSIWDLPSIPDAEVNIGYWALRIARDYDSSINIDKYLYVLDTMAAKIKHMVGPRNEDMTKFLMTKMYLFDPGVWNDSCIYSYDLNDPLGEQSGARLLTTYLDTRLGNCVTMPTLFLALMERVDPEVPFCGVVAPLHLFCRFYDRQTGTTWNVECTNGGNSMRDEWIVQQFSISPVAVDSGALLRDLTKKEYIAELIGILVSRFRKAGQYETALQYTDLMLNLNPKSIAGLVQQGSLLGWQGYKLQEKIKFEDRYPSESEIKQLRYYALESDNYIKRAKSLGWESETPESKAEYLRLVRELKSSNSK